MTKELTPNMTSEKLDEIMAAMPPEMEESEVCALTLTIYRAYMDNPGDIIANLISTIYSLGLSIGLDYEAISEGLRQTADMQDEDYRKGVRH